jgi:enoyl-CoA hydratase/carnithine racemase/3-hydroxyacyl-CoA dehydrogenase
MVKSMRHSTLETLGLGTVLEIFKHGQLPLNTAELVELVFGKADNRGALVISGANGIVGAGKMMQLGVRLQPYGVPIVGLDFAGAPDGIGFQYQGLAGSFGKKRADEIMSSIVRLNYEGNNLPPYLKKFNPRFLLEAIPEMLEIKKSHYKVFREAFPGIEIRSVTSGFPSSELDVGIAHPAFPHQINKIWEIVEEKPSAITKLFWSLGLIPVPVSDSWAFVLDVLFCGLTLAGLRYHEATNMPFWKIDKYIRRLLGPNPFRAHDVIGAKGANFLTWSCLHHLAKHYGKLFEPTPSLIEHKDSGQNWYPLNHLRPMVNWTLEADENKDFETWILGPLFQMTSLILHEKRAHLTNINAIGELCAQFRQGIIEIIRSYGTDAAIKIVEGYHKFHPEAAGKAWYPDAFKQIDNAGWQQLYVNAEHDGKVGVITISRESYNHAVNAELNRAIDWLKTEGINRVIVTGDFHLSTQLVGADTNEFFPALHNEEEGFKVAYEWSKTARRLYNEFKISVGFINGKRCLGGMLELILHCRYVVSLENADLGAPEVTLPVVPGMEMCHLPFRKTAASNWQKLLRLLLEGKPVKAKDASGWLIDYSGGLDDSLKLAWRLANNGEATLPQRELIEGSLAEIPEPTGLTETDDTATIAARKAILENIRSSCHATLSEALTIQARNSASFMTSKHCQYGMVGTEFSKTMDV